jgi:hypothetical protein
VRQSLQAIRVGLRAGMSDPTALTSVEQRQGSCTSAVLNAWTVRQDLFGSVRARGRRDRRGSVPPPNPIPRNSQTPIPCAPSAIHRHIQSGNNLKRAEVHQARR